MNNHKFEKLVDNLSNEDLWLFFAFLERRLKEKGLVRSRNIVGERGEFLAIETYNKIPGLPKLQAAPEGTKNVDAISRKGERYSIKTLTEPSSTTGVFYGTGSPGDKNKPEKIFEFVIMVQIDKNYVPKKILELSWAQFLKFRRWRKTMRAWNISITKEVLNDSKIIFENKQDGNKENNRTA